MSEFQNEQVPVEPEQAEPGVEEEAPWAPTREEFQQLQEATTFLAQQYQQQQAAQNGEGQMPDPYADPEGFQAWIDGRVEEKFAPIQEFRQSQELHEGEERAMDIIQSLQDAEGEFMVQADRDNPVGSAQIARMLADEYLEDQEARYGQGPKAAEAALNQAYKEVRAWEQRAYQAGYERQTNQMQTRLAAPMQPPAGPQAAAVQAGQYGSEVEVARAYTGGLATGR